MRLLFRLGPRTPPRPEQEEQAASAACAHALAANAPSLAGRRRALIHLLTHAAWLPAEAEDGRAAAELAGVHRKLALHLRPLVEKQKEAKERETQAGVQAAELMLKRRREQQEQTTANATEAGAVHAPHLPPGGRV